MIDKPIAPLSIAKISGTLYAALGLFFGAIVSAVALAGGLTSSEAPFFLAMMGTSAIVVLPIFYGCMGFVAALVAAWLYNVLAGVVGGIELDIQ